MLIKKISPLLAFFFLIYGCDSNSKIWTVFREEDLLEHPPAKRCADCHLDIYNQWKQSRHSVAWVSEGYKKATRNYSKTKCLSCHAPLEMSLNEKPQLREKHKKDGVNCVSCHFSSKDMSMHGPYDSFSPPHPSKEDKNFRKSIVCSSCHQQTYKQWKKASVSKTCQSCHMQPVKKGSLIQKFPFTYLHFPKEIYNHKFITGIAKENDIEVKAVKEDNLVKVILLNKGIPHNLPTADNGKPKFYVVVTTYENGKEKEKLQTIITEKYGMEYNKKKELDFYTFENYNSIKVEIFRKLSWEKKKKLIKSILIQF